MRLRSWMVALLLGFAAAALASDTASAASTPQEAVRGLRAADPSARRAAVAAIAAEGRDASRHAPDLLPLLGDDDPEVRLATVEALQSIHARGDAVAVAAWRCLAGDDDERVRAAARRLTRKLDVESAAAAAELRRTLQSEHADARRSAAQRLGDGAGRAPGDEDALFALVLDDPDDRVRAAAIRALAELGSPLSGRQAVLRKRLGPGDEALRLRAVELLGEAAPLESASASALADLLLGNDPDEIQRAALSVLRRNGSADRALAGRLLAELAKSEGSRLENCVLGLGAVGVGSRAEVAALLALRVQREGPRAEALKSLIELCDRGEALDEVAAALDSSGFAYRAAAADVLRGVGDSARSQSATLARLVESDPEAEVRSAALQALTAVATEAEARAAIETALHDRSPSVRSTARVQLKILQHAADVRERLRAGRN